MGNEGPDSFGELVHVFRKQKRLTQQQLAEAMGVHRHTIVRWEQGDVLPASKTVVLDLARCLRLGNQEARRLLEASMTAPTPLWSVPLPRNPFFTGREATLAELHTRLNAEQAVMRTRSYALQGLGGVGKTHTALEYAYRHVLEYNAIFWIEAESSERVMSSLQRIAELLRLPEREAEDQRRVVVAIQRWLTAHDNWLLIWDNLEDLTLPQRVLPQTRQGTYLFTTRRQALGTLAQGINLRPMNQEESILLLLRRAKFLEPEAMAEQMGNLKNQTPGDYMAALELVTFLGGLPLALDQAGAYLEETSCGLPTYLQRYERQKAFLLARRGEGASDHPHSVSATFLLAHERLEQEQNRAAELLRVCSFLHAEDIPEELFEVGAHHLGPNLASIVTDPVAFDLTLAALRNLSLIQRHSQTQTLSLHRLVQVVLREQMDANEVRLWRKRVIYMVNAAFPKPNLPVWQQCERYLTQALACVSLIEGLEEDLLVSSELLHKIGAYLFQRGIFEEAEPLLAKAVVLEERRYGLDQPGLIPYLSDQAELAWRQGKLVMAEALFSRVLEIAERHLEPAHVDIGEALNNLALLYWEQGKHKQAEPLYQRALHILEVRLEPEDLRIADTLNNLALLYKSQGIYKQAEPLYQRALRIKEQTLGVEHPKFANALDNLGMLYVRQGKYLQAKMLCEQALHIREQILGSEHPDISVSLYNLATLYHAEGKHEQAEQFYQHTLQLREHVLGAEHIAVATALNGLATLYREQEKYAQAKELYERALRVNEQALGSEHPRLAISLDGLATLYREQEKYAQAESLYERAIQLYEHAQGPNHSEIAAVLDHLAVLYCNQEKYAQAESLYERAMQIRERTLGATHPDMALLLSGLANLYATQGKHGQAEILYKRALLIQEEHLDAHHPATTKIIETLLSLYPKGGKQEQATI
ncbi:FxSxx-COOH system tetratricopeptide repeat protein [Ktedonospora formicarum]|uniref:Tetratricopeptide repeat protein n=1 Tax=Ktedonospora formicarum TaxID=2778364 RepID=A0A8J3I321_9CHLR|nr:FxSxx-COOH system tetratricopeptide repeat protein [Ktedonospora formicarum]GHO45930.1 tetratricopeptide repeat protein [Ktedonospora formicarum]